MFLWLPQLIGVVALLLAIDGLRELLYVPATQASFVLAGVIIEGIPAWTAAAVHTTLLAWLAVMSFQRRAVVVPAVLGYAGYMIVSIWVWSFLYPTVSEGTHLITSSLVTVLLLVVCRIVLLHRPVFRS